MSLENVQKPRRVSVDPDAETPPRDYRNTREITIITMHVNAGTSLFRGTSSKYPITQQGPPPRQRSSLPPICPTIYSTCAVAARKSSLSLHPFHAARSTSPRTDIFITRNRSLTAVSVALAGYPGHRTRTRCERAPKRKKIRRRRKREEERCKRRNNPGK